jgi:opacity protein-like surface antigen
MRSIQRMVGVALLAGALVGCAATARAQGHWELGFEAGAGFPMNDFGDAMSAGFDGAIFADYWATPAFAFGIDMGGSAHDATDEFNDFFNDFTEEVLLASGATTAESDLELSTSIVRFGVRGTLGVPTGGPVRPFLQVGGGIYRMTTKIEGTVIVDGGEFVIDEAEDDSFGGLNVGGGMVLQISPRVSFGAQAKFHNVFTEDESTQYYGVHAVLRLEVGGPS